MDVLEKQPAQKPVKEPVIKKIEEPAVIPGPAVVPANDAEETKRANEKEIHEKTAEIADEENIHPEIVLGGVITGEGEPYAIVNGEIVKKGTVVDGAEIISNGNNSVTYSFGNREYTIKLR